MRLSTCNRGSALSHVSLRPKPELNPAKREDDAVTLVSGVSFPRSPFVRPGSYQ